MREWQKSGLLFCASMLFFLCISELLIRLAMPIDRKIYEMDDRYIYKLRPNACELFVHTASNGGNKISSCTNSRGFRGREFSDKKSTKRIIVYGDSFIHGRFSRLKDTFSYRLQENINDILSDQIEVLNAGVASYGPDQAITRIEDEIDIFEPDLIILSIFSENDYGDLIRNKMFRIRKGIFQKEQFVVERDIEKELNPDNFGYGKFENYSMVIRLLKQFYWYYLDKESYNDILNDYINISLNLSTDEYNDYLNDNNKKVMPVFQDHYDADVSLNPNSPFALYKMNLMSEMVGYAKSITESKNIPLLVLIIPSAIDVCDDYDTRVNELEYPEYDRSVLTKSVENAAKEKGVDFVNLYTYFNNYSPCSDLYFSDGDSHWNDLGQKLAAKHVASAISRLGLLPQ